MAMQPLEQRQDAGEQEEDQARSHILRSGHKEMADEQICWQDAVKDFQLNLERLAKWATGENITLTDFRVRHLQEYIAVRSEGTQGRGNGGRVCERTLRHDAICIRVFIRCCAAERYILPTRSRTMWSPKPQKRSSNARQIRKFLHCSKQCRPNGHQRVAA